MFVFLCAGEQAARSFIGQNRQQTSCLTVYITHFPRTGSSSIKSLLVFQFDCDPLVQLFELFKLLFGRFLLSAVTVECCLFAGHKTSDAKLFFY